FWVEFYIYKSSVQFFELYRPIRGNCDLHQWRKSGNLFRRSIRTRASWISTFLSFMSYLSVIFGSKQASVALSLSTANIEWTKARESRIQDTEGETSLCVDRIRREQITAVICKSRIEILDSMGDLLSRTTHRPQTRSPRTEIDKPPAATN
ncbi:hypothetical protein ALC57_03363, partial [Trachymyrmex cornetzi]